MSDNAKHGIWGVIIRELKRMSSRPIYLLMALVLPLTSFFFFWLFFYQGIPREMSVAVFDSDHSTLSHKLTRMIDATASMQINYKVNDVNEGKTLLEKGACYAFIVFPKDMEYDALNGHAPKVINYFNNFYLLSGSIINRDVRHVVGTVSAGIDLSRRQKQGEMYDAAIAHLEPIKLKSEVLFNPYVNYFYFLSGTLNPTMLQIFVFMLSIYVLGIELKEGTAKEWLNEADGNAWKAVIGKLVPYTFIFIILGFFMNTYHFYFLGAPQRGSFFLINISTIALIFAYQAIALFIVSITANLRFALSIGALYSGTSFAFVGMTFPLIAMPTIAKIWAAIIPLTYYLQVFIDQSMRGFSISFSLTDFGALILFILLLPPIAIKRFGKVMRDPQYWGKI
jgi:ABC-2 type transport system permease protein